MSIADPALIDRGHATIALTRLAWLMCFAVAIGGALAEICLLWVWLNPQYVEAYVVPHLGLPAGAATLDGGTRAAGFAISMLPLAMLFYALHQAYALFDDYRLGRVLSQDAPLRLRRIGLTMLALAIARPIANMALSVALTAANPPGEKMLTIGISLDDYMIAVFGGLVLAIGHAMVEANRIADENRQII